MSHVLKWLLCYWPIIFTSIKLILNREGTLELPYLCRDLENYVFGMYYMYNLIYSGAVHPVS